MTEERVRDNPILAESPGKDWADCTCWFECSTDSHAGWWHQREDDPCPVHPGAPSVG